MTKFLILIFTAMLIFGCVTTDDIKDNSIVLNNDIWKKECIGNTFNVQSDTLVITLSKRQAGNRRCEFTNDSIDLFKNNLDVQFIFTPKIVDDSDSQWHSIFQIHSFPDLILNERWRCPILSIEVHQGKLRIFNRWDIEKLSILNDGTCASSGNTISSRLILDQYEIKENKKYKVEIDGKLSFREDGILMIRINDVLERVIEGPNAFNDNRGPYFKFGIYKPSSWESVAKYRYIYESVKVK